MLSLIFNKTIYNFAVSVDISISMKSDLMNLQHAKGESRKDIIAT